MKIKKERMKIPWFRNVPLYFFHIYFVVNPHVIRNIWNSFKDSWNSFVDSFTNHTPI